jgi:predicted DNA-binding transcriptional regulator AlpA
MNEQYIQMINLSKDDLSNLITNCVSEQFKKLQNSKSIITEKGNSFKENDLLTRKEVSEILKVSFVTLWKFNNDGTLKVKSKIGRRVYYSKKDLTNLLNDVA